MSLLGFGNKALLASKCKFGSAPLKKIFSASLCIIGWASQMTQP